MNIIKLKEKAFATNFLSREAYKALRTNIQFCGKDIKVIAVISNDSNEGKTTTTIELAKSLCEAGKKVLLIDADMRRSDMLNRYSTVKALPGLSQLLSGMNTLDEVLFTAENENFDIIFAGKYPPNPSELLGSSDFKALIDSQRDNYDYIFVDCPPVGLVIDGAIVSSVCDGALMVIRVGKVKYRDAQDVKLQIEKSGCKFLGVILNTVEIKSKSYYNKYYNKYYGKYYSKYYN